MPFFYPGADSREESLAQWQARRDSIETRDRLHDRKIWRIRYSQDGNLCVRTVGENALAIFEGDICFYICSEDRPGWIIAGQTGDPTIEVWEFDDKVAPPEGE